MSTKKRSPSKKRKAVDKLTVAQLKRIVEKKKLRKVPEGAKKAQLAKVVADRLTLKEINAAKGARSPRKSAGKKKKSAGKKKVASKKKKATPRKSAGKKKKATPRKKSAGKKKMTKEDMLNKLSVVQLKKLAADKCVRPRPRKGKPKGDKKALVDAFMNKYKRPRVEEITRPYRTGRIKRVPSARKA